MALVCTIFIPSISTIGTCWNIRCPSFERRKEEAEWKLSETEWNFERSYNRDATAYLSNENSLRTHAIKANSKRDFYVECFRCSFNSPTGQCVPGFPESTDACSVGPCSSSPFSYCQCNALSFSENIILLVGPCQPHQRKELKATASLFLLFHSTACVQGSLDGHIVWNTELTQLTWEAEKLERAERGHSQGKGHDSFSKCSEFKPFLALSEMKDWPKEPHLLHGGHFSSLPPSTTPNTLSLWLLPDTLIPRIRYLVLPLLNLSQSSGVSINFSSNWKAETVN